MKFDFVSTNIIMCFKSMLLDINKHMYTYREIFLKILVLAVYCGMVTITSCSDDSDGIPGWPWNDNSTEETGNSRRFRRLSQRYVWIDAAATFPDYANNKENTLQQVMVKSKKTQGY